MSAIFFSKMYRLWDVEKHYRARQDTDLNIVQRMRTARWIPKAIDVHSQYLILTVFPLQRCLHNRTSLLR